MVEGIVWIGGEASPPAQGEKDFLWYLWAANSSKPCAECARRDGTSTPVRRPKHSHCSCTESEDWRVCFFQSRQLVSSSTKTEKVLVGQVEAGDSASFTRGESDTSGLGMSFKGLSGNASHNENSNSRYNFENEGQETKDIFELWQVNTDTYIDTYDCKGSDKNEQVEVQRVETIFSGFSDSEAETEVIVTFE